jgi:hypothetical protein
MTTLSDTANSSPGVGVGDAATGGVAVGEEVSVHVIVAVTVAVHVSVTVGDLVLDAVGVHVSDGVAVGDAE